MVPTAAFPVADRKKGSGKWAAALADTHLNTRYKGGALSPNDPCGDVEVVAVVYFLLMRNANVTERVNLGRVQLN